ncbi:MAG: tyrosine-type recombinase/integrase [Janthinobacterium lividum]
MDGAPLVPGPPLAGPLPSRSASELAVPVLVAAAGERVSLRFLEFFAAAIRNPHTRRAYARAVADFLAWCEDHGVPSVVAVQPLHVAAWIELQACTKAAPTAKLRLAALRHLFDWLVTGGVLPTNPAASVRGPRHVVKVGRTPVLEPAEARAVLDAIDVTTPIGLRDRALIGLMVFSFARVGAALGMTVEDVFTQGPRLWVRLQEKGGKAHAMPCHHSLDEYLHAYLDGAGIAGDGKGPLFRTVGRGTGRLTRTLLPQANAYAMIRRRAAAAGIETKVGNHSFRATGITAYLKAGGTLENAAAMANHASTRTTQLYDRRQEEVSLAEVERIRL